MQINKFSIDSILDGIDTRQGSQNTYEFGNGNTLPYTSVPFAMNHFVQMTRWGDVRFFHPEDVTTYGVRLTHQPSPWMGDFCYSVYQAMIVDQEKCQKIQETNGQTISPDLAECLLKANYQVSDAVFSPYGMQYEILKDYVMVTCVPTLRGVVLDFACSNQAIRQRQAYQIASDNSFVCAIIVPNPAELAITKDAIKLNTRYHSGSKHKNVTQYVNVKGLDSFEMLAETYTVMDDHEVTIYFFKASQSIEKLSHFTLSLSTSYISHAQAQVNYEQDAFFTLSLEDQWQESRALWQDYLQRIQVSHRDSNRVKTFYACLYRTALFPQMFHEVSQEGDSIHYSPSTGKVEAGVVYTNNGYWDTFRTNYPLYALIIPEKIPEFIEGILNIYREDGYLPKWLSPDERGLMPGTLVDGVLADAVIKGFVSNAQAKEILQAMLKTQNQEGHQEHEGREGAEEYHRLGYLTMRYEESVNKTLDYAYSDFCIGQVAAAVGEEDLAQTFWTKSLNYRNLFDGETKLMRPRDVNGNFLTPFNVFRWGDHYTEGSAWQNSLSVFHNIQDCIAMYGGDTAFYDFLCELVNQLPLYNDGGYGQEIHEMVEMGQVSFGQLAISNQPSFHLPYLFIYAGYPQMTHLLICRLLDLFHTGFDGYPGDEDNGSLSSWYVLSSLGLYAMTPGTDQYVLGMNVFDSAVLSNGQKELIRWQHRKPQSSQQVVISRRINDQVEQCDYITFKDIQEGLHIEQILGVIPSVTPNLLEHRPYSLSKDEQRFSEVGE